MASILLALLIPSTLSAYYYNSKLDNAIWKLEMQTRELEYTNNRMKACSRSSNAQWDFLSETCSCDKGYFPFSQSGSNQYSTDICIEKENVFFSATVKKI